MKVLHEYLQNSEPQNSAGTYITRSQMARWLMNVELEGIWKKIATG
jgi:hypothetical protein